MKATYHNIIKVCRDKGKAVLSHHLGDKVTVKGAKLLGFGTAKVMVNPSDSNGWIVIDPLTWSVE